MKRGRVKPEAGLNLRDKPNGQKVTVLSHNQLVDIVDEVTFYRVRTSTGEVGFVHGNYLENMPPTRVEDSNTGAEIGAASLLHPSEEFNLTVYSGSEFIGETAKVDKDFVPELNRVNDYAKACELKVWVTSSTRNINQQVRGAIVPPATKSCHFVGHAIDMNLMLDGKLFNSQKLKKANYNNLPEQIQNFLTSIRDDNVLRWGGDFSTEDPVHIDDNFYYRNQLMYKAKLLSRVGQLNAI